MNPNNLARSFFLDVPSTNPDFYLGGAGLLQPWRNPAVRDQESGEQQSLNLLAI